VAIAILHAGPHAGFLYGYTPRITRFALNFPSAYWWMTPSVVENIARYFHLRKIKRPHWPVIAVEAVNEVGNPPFSQRSW
jgi:hypothetical protein